MTDVLCVGLNHKSAPVEMREKVAFKADDLSARLAALKALPGVKEAVVLSTCNRVELYVAGQEPEASASMSAFLHQAHGVPPGTLSPHLYTHVGEEAVRHLFRVGSSLDAIVVGEPQILGQVKDAFRASADALCVGPVLSKVFHRAFTVAKRVRTETGIAQNAVSVSFAAVELARTIYGRLDGRVCLLVGAGNMGELAARHFVQEGAALWVVNRSYERAEALAQAYGGTARAFNDLALLLEKVDVVVTSTAAPGYLITRDLMKPVMRARRYNPIFLIDIAVPRNVDPDVTKVDNVYAYDVDDLDHVVDQNLEKRRAEAARAENLVGDEVAAFRSWWQNQTVTPTIKALRARAMAVMEAELKKTLGTLGPGVTEKERKSVQAMANALVNKLLHEPLTTLKDGGPDQADLAQALRRLFNLKDDDAVEVAGGDAAASGAAAPDARAQALEALQEAEAAEAAGLKAVGT